MLDNIKTLSETLSPIFDIAWIILLGYVIIMGFANRQGKKTWLAQANNQRAKKNMPIITLDSGQGSYIPPWRDPAIIQGGLSALVIVIILMSYVVLMLGFDMLTNDTVITEQLLEKTAVLMGYPVAMLAFFNGMVIWAHRDKQTVKPLWPLIAIAIGCAIATLLIGLTSHVTVAMISQCTMLLIQSSSFSYLTGMNEGFKAANIEERFPTVMVQQINNVVLNDIRLYETTDHDYRFIGNDGNNYIIPKDKISLISYSANI